MRAEENRLALVIGCDRDCVVEIAAVGKTLNRIRELGGVPPLSLPTAAE